MLSLTAKTAITFKNSSGPFSPCVIPIMMSKPLAPARSRVRHCYENAVRRILTRTANEALNPLATDDDLGISIEARFAGLGEPALELRHALRAFPFGSKRKALVDC